MVQKIELARYTSQHKLSQQLISNLTGRENAKKDIIRGNNKQDRLRKWYEQFKILLGKEPIITHPDEEIRTRIRILSPGGKTDLFQIQAGLLQGETLAAFLFVLTVDYTMTQAIEQLGFKITPRKSQQHPAIKVTDMLFADDVALLSEEIVQAQKL